MVDFFAIIAGIKWMSLFQVAATAIGFTAGVSLLFSLGIRLLTNAEFVAPKAAKGKTNAVQLEALNRVGAYVLFAICATALLYGIYLIVPYFSK